MTISAVAALAGLIIFPLAMVYAGLMDLVTLTIRNTLVLGLLSAWLVLAPIAGFSLPELGASAAVAVFVFVVTFVFFSLGWIGGGDAKLFAATCLWLGPAAMLTYSIYAALLGGGLTLLLLAYRGLPLPVLLISQNWLTRLHSPDEGVPYGIALAAAGLLVYPDTPFMAALGA